MEHNSEHNFCFELKMRISPCFKAKLTWLSKVSVVTKTIWCLEFVLNNFVFVFYFNNLGRHHNFRMDGVLFALWVDVGYNSMGKKSLPCRRRSRLSKSLQSPSGWNRRWRYAQQTICILGWRVWLSNVMHEESHPGRGRCYISQWREDHHWKLHTKGNNTLTCFIQDYLIEENKKKFR